MSDEEDYGTGLDQHEECENRGESSETIWWTIEKKSDELFKSIDECDKKEELLGALEELLDEDFYKHLFGEVRDIAEA